MKRIRRSVAAEFCGSNCGWDEESCVTQVKKIGVGGGVIPQQCHSVKSDCEGCIALDGQLNLQPVLKGQLNSEYRTTGKQAPGANPMQAAVIEKFGEPVDVLKVRDLPVPEPKHGQLRVRMLAAPLNPSDLMVVRGSYAKLPTLPATPGFEGVGIVEKSGGGLYGKLLVGKRVAVLNSETGSWAEQAVINARQAVPLSASLSVEQAATFFVNPATAYIMTRKVLRVPQGEWLLQTAAASALGKMVIRLAKSTGFRTINVVRRREQVAELQQLGADVVLVESEGDLREQVLKQTGGKGVNYAIDPVGGATASAVVRCLGPGGRLLLFGTLSQDPVSFSPRTLMSVGASVEGFWLGNWMAQQNIVSKLRLMKTLARLILSGELSSEISETFPLAQVADAVRAAEKPRRGGKVLLRLGAS